MTAKEQTTWLYKPKNWREIGCACAVIVDGKKTHIPAAFCINCHKPVVVSFINVNYCPNCGAKVTERIDNI